MNRCHLPLHLQRRQEWSTVIEIASGSGIDDRDSNLSWIAGNCRLIAIAIRSRLPFCPSSTPDLQPLLQTVTVARVQGSLIPFAFLCARSMDDWECILETWISNGINRAFTFSVPQHYFAHRHCDGVRNSAVVS